MRALPKRVVAFGCRAELASHTRARSFDAFPLLVWWWQLVSSGGKELDDGELLSTVDVAHMKLEPLATFDRRISDCERHASTCGTRLALTLLSRFIDSGSRELRYFEVDAHATETARRARIRR
jgi:hypothetical protein